MTEEELLGYFKALNTDGDDYLNKDEFMAMAQMDGTSDMSLTQLFDKIRASKESICSDGCYDFMTRARFASAKAADDYLTNCLDGCGSDG